MAERILEGKVVMITGAGRGMGRTMSIALAEAGAKLAVIDVDKDVLAATRADVETAGGQGCAMETCCDVTSPDATRAALEAVLVRLGRLDVLVNNAVVGPQRLGEHFLTEPPKFWELDDGLFREMLEVNVFGPQLMARTVTPTLVEAARGGIINVTTSLDTMYRPGVGAYGPSKAALEAHTRIMAHDLQGTGVCANVLIPGGPVNTRMIPAASGIDRAALIQPEIMCEPIVWMCSDDAQGVTGLRFIAMKWDATLAREARIDKASAPIAWPQLGAQAIEPA